MRRQAGTFAFGRLGLATAIVAAGALGALAFPLGAKATVITVSPGQSIAAAVASASAGDIIQVQPGTYTNDFPVVKCAADHRGSAR